MIKDNDYYKIPKAGIKTAQLYKDYITELETAIRGLENEIKKYSELYNHYNQYKSEIVRTVKEYGKFPLNQFTRISRVSELNKLTWKPIDANYDGLSPKQVVQICTSLLFFKKQLKSLKKEYARHLSLRFSIVEFKWISLKFWTIMTDHMVRTGYKLKFGHRLGGLWIKAKKLDGNTKKRDWHESKKKRKEIMDRGGMPYHSEAAPHGEKWYVYFDQTYDLWWRWYKVSASFKKFTIYSFEPVRNVQRKLFRYYKERPSIVNYYHDYF